LHWDQTGFGLWCKRLEKDRFKWPRTHESTELELDPQQLDWLLKGYDIIGQSDCRYTHLK
jgi:transposase